MIKRLQFMLFLVAHLSAMSQTISLMTYNIRLDVDSDMENAWMHRKEFLISQIQFHQPDIFGTQEGLPHQIKYLNNELGAYRFVGEGRNGKNKGEYSALFYNKSKFKIVKQGTFWLSSTPEVVSKGWDAALPRICTYALFKEKKSEQEFWVFNTHFDHGGVKARLFSVQLILRKIKELNTKKLPVIFMGDLNVEAESEVISYLKVDMKDTRTYSIQKPYGPKGTFNGFRYNEISNKRIDYIFVSKESKIKVQKYAALNEPINLKYPSDHFPVYVELEMNFKSKKR